MNADSEFKTTEKRKSPVKSSVNYMIVIRYNGWAIYFKNRVHWLKFSKNT